jgi:hypothetical protein
MTELLDLSCPVVRRGAGLEQSQLILERIDWGIVLRDEFHQLADAPVDAAKLRLLCLDRGILLVAQAVHLGVEYLAELTTLDSDTQAIVTSALVAGGGAAEQVLADLDVFSCG